MSARAGSCPTPIMTVPTLRGRPIVGRLTVPAPSTTKPAPFLRRRQIILCMKSQPCAPRLGELGLGFQLLPGALLRPELRPGIVFHQQDPGSPSWRAKTLNQGAEPLAVDRLGEIADGAERHATTVLVQDRDHD